MEDIEFKALGQDILDAIDFLKARGWSVTKISDLLEYIEKLPKRWRSIDARFETAENSKVNVDLFKDVKEKLKDTVISILLYDNKMVQILSPVDGTYEKLFQYYSAKTQSEVKDFSLSRLIDIEEDVDFKFKIDNRFQAFGIKTIVEDSIKEDLEEDVSQDIQDEYTVIYGIKNIKIPAMMLIIFDNLDKKIIVAMDLAKIIHPSKVDAKLSEFKVSIKSSVKAPNFSKNPVNLFPKIKEFNDDLSIGRAFDMSFKTTNDGMIHHIHANTQHPDARLNDYHNKGALGINYNMAFFRIHMSYETLHKTKYAIDLKSIASMTTQKNPVLYSAILNTTNAKDFSEALSRLRK